MTKTQAENIYSLTKKPEWSHFDDVVQAKIDQLHKELEWCDSSSLSRKQGEIAALRLVLVIDAKAWEVLSE